MKKIHILMIMLLLVILCFGTFCGYLYLHTKPFSSTITEADFWIADKKIIVTDQVKLKKIQQLLNELNTVMKFPQSNDLEGQLMFDIKSDKKHFT